MRFKEYTDEWTKYRCSDFLKAYTTNSLSWDKLSYEESDGLLNLHYGLIHNGAPTLIDTDSYNLPKIVKDTPKSYELCKNGDVIFADASEDTNDICKSVEIYKTNGKSIVSGLHTIHTRDYKKLTCVGFKGYLFSSKLFHKQVFRLTQGTKIFSINFSNFREMHVSIPQKDEQLKIVKFLSKIDARIETQNKIIKDLELVKKGISNTVFGDKSTIKNSWVKIKLSSILKERKTYDVKDSIYPHATLSKEGISAKTDRYNRDFLVKDEEKEYKITHLNDICYNPANLKFGVICLNTFGDAIFSPIYVTYEIDKKCDPYFISLYLTNPTFIGHIRKYEQGTVYERMAVSTEDFLRGEINLPSYEEQLKIAKMFKSIDEKIAIEQAILDKLKEQKKFLLFNMFI